MIIKVALNESSDTRSFDNLDEMIHHAEFTNAESLVSQAIKRIENQSPPVSPNYSHHTITILGTRGSGKSSFLLSLQKKFENEKQVQILNLIDPTLIEEKGHIFLNIIALLVSLVDDYTEQNQFSSGLNINLVYKEWRDQMLKLAAGLPSIDGIGKDTTDGWQDPEFVMDSGLKAVKSANELAVNFHEFLQKSLDILRKKVFLLFFDDIDVEARKGLAVLETIRKYLNTPLMITVLSGDSKLYSAVIRQKKWQSFGKEILEYEGVKLSRMSIFNDMVTELTTQYLLKVLQPKYRIHLSTLLEKKVVNKTFRVEIVTENGDNSNENEIELYYNRLFKSFGVSNDAQQEVYRTFMLGLPFRSQIQFLLSVQSESSNNEKLSDVFLADLLEKVVDINLANHSPKYLQAIILKLLLEERRLLDLYQLQPTTQDTSLNSSLFCLWMLLSKYIQKYSFLIFDYFMKIAYVRNLLSIIPYKIDKDIKNQSSSPNIEELCEIGDVHNDGVLRDVTSAIQSYILGSLEFSDSANNITPFYTRLLAMENVVKLGATDRMDVVFKDADKATCILAFIPCYLSTYLHKNESRLMYSIYVLLGTIGEIIKQYEIVSSSDKDTFITNLLKILSQLRSYPVPNFKNNNNSAFSRRTETESLSRRESEDDPVADDNSDTSDLVLAKSISTWLNNKTSTPVSAHLLGKMFTRFYYSMNNISTAVAANKDIQLGYLFHLQVSAFMNAVIVEDSIENIEHFSPNINNTRLTDSVLLANLTKLNGIGNKVDSLNLSKWLVACPLLVAYLNPDSGLQPLLQNFCGNNLDLSVLVHQLHTSLNKVTIAGQKNDETNNQEKRRRREYTELDGSAELLNDMSALTSIVKDHLPKRWFTYTTNKEEMDYRNQSIQTYAKKIFGNQPKDISNINKFRDYLRSNKDAWK